MRSGLLERHVGDAQRAIRPLAGLLADPAGWLRSADSLAPIRPRSRRCSMRCGRCSASPAHAGTPLALGQRRQPQRWPPPARARGWRSTSIPRAWTAPGRRRRPARRRRSAPASRVGPTGPPGLGLELHVGISRRGHAGRQAVYARIGASGIELFVRPASRRRHLARALRRPRLAGRGGRSRAALPARPAGRDRRHRRRPGRHGRRRASACAPARPRKFDGAALHDLGHRPGRRADHGRCRRSSRPASPRSRRCSTPSCPTAVSAHAPTPTRSTVSVGDVRLAWSPATGVVIAHRQRHRRARHRAAQLHAGAVSASRPRRAERHRRPGSDRCRRRDAAALRHRGGGQRADLAGRAGSWSASPSTPRIASPPAGCSTRHQFDLVASDGAMIADVDTMDPAQVALRIVEVVADLVAAVAMAQPTVAGSCSTRRSARTDVRDLLRGVVLLDAAEPDAADRRPVRPGHAAGRACTSCSATSRTPASRSRGRGFKLVVHHRRRHHRPAARAGSTASQLVDGDVMLWLENDDSWITPTRRATAACSSASCSTLPLRVHAEPGGQRRRPARRQELAGRCSTSASRSTRSRCTPSRRSTPTGVQRRRRAAAVLQPRGLRGRRQRRQRHRAGRDARHRAHAAQAGVLARPRDPEARQRRRCRCRCAPATAPGRGGSRSRRASARSTSSRSASARTMPNEHARAHLAADGRPVSMFGLTGAVDDLPITYIVADGDFFNPDNWAVDLAGLAVSADMAGVSLAGGLLKQPAPAAASSTSACCSAASASTASPSTAATARAWTERPDSSPPSSSSARSTARSAGRRRSSSPASAAASASTAGWSCPTDLSQFGDYPLIKALDPAAQPRDPMAELRELRPVLPAAAGHVLVRRRASSFNSFALVDGIAVVARRSSATGSRSTCSAWPAWRCRGRRWRWSRSSSALLARFSTSEGVLWVQAQLTDNSWLLYPDVRLTGGFAFVHLVQGRARGPVRAHARRLPPRLPPRRLPGGAAPGPALERRRRHRHQGRAATSR